MAVTAKAKAMKSQGIDVVGFGSGEPDFDTPDFIKEAAKASLDAGETKYTAASGTPQLRAAVAKRVNSDYSLDYAPENVIVSLGAKFALYTACQALLDPEDEVIIPTPYWVSYPEMVKQAGGTPVYVEGREEDNFNVSADSIRGAITDRTKILILNSPNNPGGFIYEKAELEAIAKVLGDYPNVLVFSDEIYEKLVFGGAEFTCFASIAPDLRDRTILFSGAAKTFAMTGWRVGWAIGPAAIIKAMGSIQSHATSNPPSMAQPATIAALESDYSEVRAMCEQYAKRAGHMHERVNAIDGFSCNRPQGAFYAFANVSGCYGREVGGQKVTDSLSFTGAVLETAQVALVPGVAFGHDTNVRLSYATSMEQIDKGLDRLEKLFGRK
jgi:aspartate aminotransferase